jgi:hypothetical protein
MSRFCPVGSAACCLACRRTCRHAAVTRQSRGSHAATIDVTAAKCAAPASTVNVCHTS